MRVLFTIAGMHPESGGPARSVPALGAALAQAGVEVEVLSLDYGKRSHPPLTPDSKLVRTTYVDCSAPLAFRMRWTPTFTSALRARCRQAHVEIVHDTALWLLTNHGAASVSEELRLPRVVSPRGMLTSWALQHKGWKKRLAWHLYQRHDLQTARLLHATSPSEAEDFRAAGLKQAIAVIPNGVALPLTPSTPDLRPSAHENRTVLFLSRIHPKKGLLNLVKAWATVRPRGWRVIIAGSGENRHRAELEAAIHAEGLESAFSLVGSVDDDGKEELYRQADLFILPSHSENFGIVVAEALAHGVPVITTHGAPWQGLVEKQCGWWTEIGSEPLAQALREAVSRSDEERRTMGGRGRAWMGRDFAWAGVAAKMQSVYAWLLGRGPKPDCVIEG